MLQYEEFKKIVEKEIVSYVPQGIKVIVEKTTKVNVLSDSIIFIKKEQRDNVAYPSICINNMYRDYCNEKMSQKELSELIKRRSNECISILNKSLNTSNNILDYSKITQQVVFQLINTEKNKELLSAVPNRPFLDLSVIYRWIIGEDRDGGIISTIVTEALEKKVSLDERSLFKCAIVNTPKLRPFSIANLTPLLNVLDPYNFQKESERGMWIIGNEKNSNGATALLYNSALSELAERLQSDLYIIPSSIHEVIAIPVFFMGIPSYDLLKMVVEVNQTEVPPEEILSDNVYFYDRTQKTVSIASDIENTRNKCL